MIDPEVIPAFYPPEIDDSDEWHDVVLDCDKCSFHYEQRVQSKAKKPKVVITHGDDDYHELFVSGHRIAALNKLGWATKFRNTDEKGNDNE